MSDKLKKIFTQLPGCLSRHRDPLYDQSVRNLLLFNLRAEFKLFAQ